MVCVLSEVLVVVPSELEVTVVFVLVQNEPGMLQLMPTPPNASIASCAIAAVGSIEAGKANALKTNNRFIMETLPTEFGREYAMDSAAQALFARWLAIANADRAGLLHPFGF